MVRFSGEEETTAYHQLDLFEHSVKPTNATYGRTTSKAPTRKIPRFRLKCGKPHGSMLSAYYICSIYETNSWK